MLAAGANSPFANGGSSILRKRNRLAYFPFAPCVVAPHLPRVRQLVVVGVALEVAVGAVEEEEEQGVEGVNPQKSSSVTH